MAVEHYTVGREFARRNWVRVKLGRRFTKRDHDALNKIFEIFQERFGPFERHLERIESGCAEILRRAGLPDRPGRYIWRRYAGEQKWRWFEQTPEDNLNDITQKEFYRLKEAHNQLKRLNKLKLKAAEKRRRRKQLEKDCEPRLRLSTLGGAASIEDGIIPFDEPAGYAVRILDECNQVRQAVASGKRWDIAREGCVLGLLIQEAEAQRTNQERRKKPRGVRNPWIRDLVKTLCAELRAKQQPLTARKAWDLISDDEYKPSNFSLDGEAFEIYRSERDALIPLENADDTCEVLAARRDRDGKSYSVAFHTFRRYFTKNRNSRVA